jgi:hypothetical protein
MDQKHLNHNDTVNFGSFYTPEWLVDIVYSLIQRNLPDLTQYSILDTSCGYGGFLRGQNTIGADIDEGAIKTARGKAPHGVFIEQNSLLNISRSQYNLDENAKIIIVGNPPYNDTTSFVKNHIKRNKLKSEIFERDADVISRDLGISFLLSYDKMQADYICVLHPLSYLIKKANFESLLSFNHNYKLTDSVVVSSGVFSDTSQVTHFPIIIGFYERNPSGMDYDYIANYKFKTNEGKAFSLRQYDTIGKYISKYPNHNKISNEETVAYFYTMRDINALKRMATFIDRETCCQKNYAVRVTKQQLPYYCYVDVFKEYIPHIPYYFGNSDIMIDNDAFAEIQDSFVCKSIKKHPSLSKYAEIKKVTSILKSRKRRTSRRTSGSYWGNTMWIEKKLSIEGKPPRAKKDAWRHVKRELPILPLVQALAVHTEQGVRDSPQARFGDFLAALDAEAVFALTDSRQGGINLAQTDTVIGAKGLQHLSVDHIACLVDDVAPGACALC